jgi:hypothetical protein
MRLCKWLAVAISFILCVLPTLPVTATALPSGTITVESVRVVRNTIQPNDFALVFHYNIPYGTYPPDPSSSTIMFRFYSADGLTLLAAARPYVYYNTGYRNGVGSFYFGNTTAPLWGGAYILNISGSPAFFDPLPPPVNHVLATDEYYAGTTQASNQIAMANYILNVVIPPLEVAYPTVLLKTTTDTSVALTTEGETYFRGAVPGIQSIAPTLFSLQAFSLTSNQTISTNISLATDSSAHLAGSDIMGGLAGLNTVLGMGLSADIIAGGLVFIGSVLICIATTRRRNWGLYPGLILSGAMYDGAGWLIGGGVMILDFAIAFMLGVAMMWNIFGKRG